ncbi:MAG: glutathione S-transferase family protein [Emcibacter sp.]|nr:glutathione S-transferase family protein [Emcibacter sp.]
MVKLLKEDIRTKEVLDWKGLHLFHMPLSSCSQKLRIFLNIKGLEWQSHVINLLKNENLTPYFLGINPRGLVPTLVDNGDVHIESNDILVHLENRFPEIPLIPSGKATHLKDLLKDEDDLHLDLRALSFRFLFTPPAPPKNNSDLESYANTGSGTVGGVKDTHIDREINFWKELSLHGITDQIARNAAKKFFTKFTEIETQLMNSPYIMGDDFSLLDIAWVVYIERLLLAGYPLKRLHPRLYNWQEEQRARPEVGPEIALPADMADILKERQQALVEQKQTLEDICFPL